MSMITTLQQLRVRFLSIQDPPHAIARGAAIGIYFGFTPLFGLKTLLAIGVATLWRGNKVAAAIAVTAHDLTLPLLPILLRWEYDIGYWLLSHPNQLPSEIHLHHLSLKLAEWLQWSTFLKIGRPVLLGATVIGLPIAALAYGITFQFTQKRERARLINKKPA